MTPNPPDPEQITYIYDLREMAGLPRHFPDPHGEPRNEQIAEWMIQTLQTHMDDQDAAALRDGREIPERATDYVRRIPEGRYLLDGRPEPRTYHVKHGTDRQRGRVFLYIDRGMGMGMMSVQQPRTRDAILDHIARDPRSLAQAYGRRFERCWRCNMELGPTDYESPTEWMHRSCAATAWWF